VPLEYDDRVVKLIVGRCTEIESGGRMIDAILTNTLLPRISREILVRLGEGRPVTKVSVSAPAEDFEYAFG
jgi:type VI secretion system protein VasG